MVSRKYGLARRAAVVALSLNLGACFGGGSSDFSASEALELGTGMLALGAAAAGVASASSGSGYRPSAPVYRSPAPVVSRGNGYSQKGAFDDCAAVYGSVGASAQADICRKRSANMGSLTR